MSAMRGGRSALAAVGEDAPAPAHIARGDGMDVSGNGRVLRVS